jgi:hypothetical protein
VKRMDDLDKLRLWFKMVHSIRNALCGAKRIANISFGGALASSRVRSSTAVFLAFASSFTNAAAVPEYGLVGQIVSFRVNHVAGWDIESRHSWCVVDAVDPTCTMIRLRSGRTIAVALTKPTRNGPLGGIAKERIYRVFFLKLPHNARAAECRSINGRPSVAGWLQSRLHAATIFTTDGHSLKRWVVKYTDEAPCEIGQN